MSDNDSHASSPLILLAGATGELGIMIARHLAATGARLRVVIRKDSRNTDRIGELNALGAELRMLSFNDSEALLDACRDVSCLVSAVSGLEDVIVGLQSRLLKAAVGAGVPRFIPSDYCIDYTKLSDGQNRNLDLRWRFGRILDAAPVRATSILNGMFTELLRGQAPLIQKPLRRVMYWGNARQAMDFTTHEDTAAFTAKAALDPEAPRYLRIAGDVQSIKGLAAIATEVYRKPFRTLRLGGLGLLNGMIAIVRSLSPSAKVVFPAWQGMLYLRDMLSGRPKLDPLDNDRYGAMPWTSVSDVLGGMRDKS
jgi:nucleoside-diphosphate-sugar epimerase